MLLLRYYVFSFYTNYASTEKQCYVVSCLSVYFLPPQRSRTIQAIGWEVRFVQHFRRSRELMSLNFRMPLLCYHYIIVFAVFTPIMLRQISLLRSCVTLIICFYFYSWSDVVMVHSIYYFYIRKHCHITAILSHGRIFSKDLLLCWISAIIWIWYYNFVTIKEA